MASRDDRVEVKQTTTNSYDDADVTDGDYVDYFVTAVYDEGETVSSNSASARAGLPTEIGRAHV